MVKKAEGEETAEVEAPEVEAPETPTAEEQLKAAQEEIDKIKAELESKDKGLRTAHQTLTEKDKKLREASDFHTRLDGFEETQKILIGMMQERGAVSDEEVSLEKRTDYVKQYDEIRKRQKEEREAASMRTEQEEYARQAQAIYARAQEAFKDDIDELDKVAYNLDRGRLDLAEARVAKVEGKEKPPAKEKQVESDEERVARLAEEMYKKRLDEEGLLRTESAEPSGRSRTMDEIAAKVASGDMTVEEAAKAGYKFG